MPLLHSLKICDVAAPQELARVCNLSTVDVAAVRLWLEKRVQPETASNVMAGFDPGVGATFFDLNTLQVCMHHIHAHTSLKFAHILSLLCLSLKALGFHKTAYTTPCLHFCAQRKSGHVCELSTIAETMPASRLVICRCAHVSSQSTCHNYVSFHSDLQVVKNTLKHLPPLHSRPVLT